MASKSTVKSSNARETRATRGNVTRSDEKQVVYIDGSKDYTLDVLDRSKRFVSFITCRGARDEYVKSVILSAQASNHDKQIEKALEHAGRVYSDMKSFTLHFHIDDAAKTQFKSEDAVLTIEAEHDAANKRWLYTCKEHTFFLPRGSTKRGTRKEHDFGSDLLKQVTNLLYIVQLKSRANSAQERAIAEREAREARAALRATQAREAKLIAMLKKQGVSDSDIEAMLKDA